MEDAREDMPALIVRNSELEGALEKAATELNNREFERVTLCDMVEAVSEEKEKAEATLDAEKAEGAKLRELLRQWADGWASGRWMRNVETRLDLAAKTMAALDVDATETKNPES